MVQKCKRCRRANPREAAYCYHDGQLLDHAAGVPADGSAINIGARPFSAPFVFPSGKACHNFVQLLEACQTDAAAALDSLRQGRLRDFLAGQGRSDLAQAAATAAKTADGERGLDEFMGRLPAPLKAASLRVEPPEIDLGTLRIGEERRFELVLSNGGERLVSGSARCEARWLALGDGPAAQGRVFQFRSKCVLGVRVVGSRLHAYEKPQQALISLQSNGGAIDVMVRIAVAVKPFAEGVLSGAISPRQLALKAREAAKEAAALIGSGAVAHWYKANGWTYPVLGPRATGLAAVQQYFEALGVVKTPRVELSEDAILLQGRPGEKIEYSIAAITQENRAAIAHGTSDQPWLEVGPTIFRGRSAFLPLLVAAVPADRGDKCQARITVVANGGQRFEVPVTLAILGAAGPENSGQMVSVMAEPVAPQRPPLARPHARPWNAYRIVRWLLVLLCVLAFGALTVLAWELWHEE